MMLASLLIGAPNWVLPAAICAIGITLVAAVGYGRDLCDRNHVGGGRRLRTYFDLRRHENDRHVAESRGCLAAGDLFDRTAV